MVMERGVQGMYTGRGEEEEEREVSGKMLEVKVRKARWR